MYTSMGWGVYVLFATALLVGSVYAYFFIHDTKGLRMDQMDHLFGFDSNIHQATPNVADQKLGDDESERHEKVSKIRTEAV